MKYLLPFILLISIAASAQAFRYDNFGATTVSASGIGNITQIIPNATITVFNQPAVGVSCAGGGCVAATTYTSRTSGTPCGGGLPLTRPTSNTCLANADSSGNFGFWVTGGAYQYCVAATNLTTQCYNVMLGATLDGNAAVKPALNGTDSVVFASNNGSDSNDCLSWGSACKTVAGACAKIPGNDSTCLQQAGFGTVYCAVTYNGAFPAGFLTGQATALQIYCPGYIQSDSSIVSAKGSLGSYQEAAFMFLFDGGIQDFIQAGPRGKECFPLTATSVTSNVLTVTCTNTFAATEVARISGTAEAFLNGQSFTVASATGAQWTANFTHANYSNPAEPSGALAQEQWLRGPSTLTLPDLALGTVTASSGALLGVTGATDAAASGDCLYYAGPTANSGLSGVMIDSGFGCNASLLFKNSTHGVLWTNGGNQTFVFPAIAPTGSWNQTLMNQSGMIALNAVGDTVYGTYRVTADQTITAGASLTNIPGLSWTMPANQALNVAFSCHLLYSQATAAASDQFGIQDVTVAPTSLMAKSQAYLSASTFTAGNLPALTTTTATAIVTFTPSAATTVWNADIDGTIEQPSNASTSAINIMAQFTTNNGTIKRGSFCTVF